MNLKNLSGRLKKREQAVLEQHLDALPAAMKEDGFDLVAWERAKLEESEKALLPVSTLFLDTENYQREPSQKKARARASDYHPLATIGIIVNIRPDGTPAVIDGGNRALLMDLSEGGEAKAWCCAICGLDIAREALLFLVINAQRTPVPRGKQFRAGALAGIESVLQIKRIIGECGLAFNHQAKRSDGEPRCWMSIEKIFKAGGEPLLKQTLRIVSESFGAKQAALKGEAVEGLALFVKRHGASFDLDDAIRKFKLETLTRVKDRYGKELEETPGAPVSAWYRAFLKTYDNRRSTGRLQKREDDDDILA